MPQTFRSKMDGHRPRSIVAAQLDIRPALSHYEKFSTRTQRCDPARSNRLIDPAKQANGLSFRHPHNCADIFLIVSGVACHRGGIYPSFVAHTGGKNCMEVAGVLEGERQKSLFQQ